MNRTGARPTARSDAGPGWVLLAAAGVVPWLVLPAGQPWPAFFGDALQATLWLVCAAALLCRRGAWSVLPASLLLAAAAFIPLLQAAAGLYLEVGDALLPALALAGIALAFSLAAQSQQRHPLRLADALLAGVLMAALASSALALMQWLQLDVLGVLTDADPITGRATANLGQPNLLATLLLWGLVAACWGHWRGQIGSPVLLLTCALLLFAVVLTQSRTGLLGVAVLALWVTLAQRRAGLDLPRAGLALLGLGFGVLVMAWPTLSAGAGLEGVRAAGELGSAGKRPAIWAAMLAAVARAPWWGYGWDQGAAAYAAVLDDRPALHVVVAHAHNLLLDLLVWNGVIPGSLLGLALLLWFGRRLRRADDPPRWLLLAALAVFGLHAMLELPHLRLLFLLPATLMAGTVQALESDACRLRLARPWVALLVAVLAALLVQLVIERQRILTDHLTHRMIAARIGTRVAAPEPPVLHLLGPVQRALVAQRIEPRPDMPPEEQQALERSVLRHPSLGGLFKAAQAAALNKRPAQAARHLRHLCAVIPTAQCAQAAQAWVYLAETRFPAMRAVPFRDADAGH